MMALGQTIDDLPLGRASDIPLYYGTLPRFVAESGQICIVGTNSEDPLVPGICNPTLLLGAALVFGLVWWLNR